MVEDMREKSVIADNMRIDWDCRSPWTMGSSCAPTSTAPSRKANIPSSLRTGPMPKACPSSSGTKTVGEHDRQFPGDQGWNHEQVPVLGGGRSREVGARRLRHRAGRLPGAGRSPGYQDCWSPREAKDIHDCVEWAAVQPWSNGKVGMLGISYYAQNQWQVSTKHQPPHLAAMCTWEAAADFYRDTYRHGGSSATGTRAGTGGRW